MKFSIRGANFICGLACQTGRRSYAKTENIMWLEPRIYVPKANEGADHQTGSNEQHESHRHLADDKHTLDAGTAAGERAPALFQCRPNIRLRDSQCGNQTERYTSKNR